MVTQSPVSGCITESTLVIPALPSSVIRNHIKIKIFWIELSSDATMVSLRWGQNGANMFPKTKEGLAGLNLVKSGYQCLSPANVPLWIHIEGNVTVCYTITFEYI